MGALKAPIDCATQDHLLAVAGFVGDRVRVGPQARAGSAAGQVRGDHLVACGAQPLGDEMPVPGLAAGAGNEYVGGHGNNDGCRGADSSAG